MLPANEAHPPDTRVFAVIDTTSGLLQVKVDHQASKLLTIVTNMGRFSYRVLPQGICDNSALWNNMTDGDSRIDIQLNLVTNLDEFLVYERN